MDSISNRKKLLTQKITAVAHANIALVKYWGKRSHKANLPAVGSISLTLDVLKTETSLQFDPSLKEDKFILDGKNVEDKRRDRLSGFLDLLIGSTERMKASVESFNNFPTGAGLASSASGFAALTRATAEALKMVPEPQELSKLARRGSGSAARSISGGFVEMKIGSEESGEFDFAVQLYDEKYWDIRILIAIVSTEPKKTGSTEGMIRTAETSPFYSGWVNSSNRDLADMREALGSKNFDRMGMIAEHSCMKMHGLMMSSRPPLLYWNPVTLETIQTIWELRREGVPAYITIDAGPQVKVICLPDTVGSVRKALEDVKGVSKVLEARPGPGAYLIQ